MKWQGGNKQRPNYWQWRQSFILGNSKWNLFQVGYPVVTNHFAATPQSDVLGICAHSFQRHGDAFGTTENARFRAFITVRSQFHLYHCSQQTLTEIVSKPPKTLDLSFKFVLKWANCFFAEHVSDSSTNYNSFLNWTFSSPNKVRTVRRTMFRS